MNHFKPKGPRVLVLKERTAKPTSSHIEVVSYSDEPSQFALVLAVGDGTLRRDGGRNPVEVKPGQRVVVKPQSGAPVRVPFNGEDIDCHLLMEDDVLMVIA